MTNSEIIMIALTAVIAAAGVVGACIFNNQLSVMQGQLDEMKSTGKQTDTMIAANKIIATAAQKSAEVAEKALTAIERPIAVINHWQPTAEMDGDKVVAWIITPVFENVGNMPGINFISQTNAAGRSTAFPDDYAFADFAANPKARVPTVIGPKQTLNLSDIRLTADYMAEVAAKTSNLIIYGWVEYDDFLEKRHRTEFSSRVNILGNAHRADARFSFPNFGGYNCVDKNCKYSTHKDVPTDTEIVPPGVTPP